jgi:hypothetical protein
LKPAILADFAKLPKLLEEARKGLGRIAPELDGKQDAPREDPKQLNLF